MDELLLSREIVRIGNRAVKKAQKESLEMGIPNVYSLNGVIFYQLPDGTITTDQPEEYKKITLKR
ncbi:hypothetical protein FHQ18_03955 [Deferribacter autotrophicus]|uniref:Uncharacterized protein n=1 Tax=Deferribacter autotrophicus TaxID=500465 RepID=A0A5A8F4Z7_9BACT|nr:hypothetical protein FHQ18_03955 [Deferribacter autotrophicus]